MELFLHYYSHHGVPRNNLFLWTWLLIQKGERKMFLFFCVGCIVLCSSWPCPRMDIRFARVTIHKNEMQA